jgi:hypothetical protein
VVTRRLICPTLSTIECQWQWWEIRTDHGVGLVGDDGERDEVCVAGGPDDVSRLDGKVGVSRRPWKPVISGHRVDVYAVMAQPLVDEKQHKVVDAENCSDAQTVCMLTRRGRSQPP